MLDTEAGPLAREGLLGRPCVLYFYPKDDTSGCTQEAIEFSQLSHQFQAAGVQVLGVSKDDLKSHARFREKHALTVRLASDPEAETAAAFGVWVEKSMYGRKYWGMERATFLIDAQGVVQRVWRKVKVPGHAAEVLRHAEALRS